MSMPVADQALTLALALSLGFALGLVLDFLRAVRRRLRGRLFRGGLDLLFALITLAALFVFGMATPLGRLQIHTIFFTAVGAALYGVTLRKIFFPVFEKAAGLLLLPCDIGNRAAAQFNHSVCNRNHCAVVGNDNNSHAVFPAAVL